MPSPIAHLALITLAHPAAQGSGTLPLSRRLMLLALCATWLVLPDFDIPIGLLFISDGMSLHGSWSHSFIWAIPAGVGFLLLGRLVLAGHRGTSNLRLFLVGTACFMAHIVMDSANWGFGNARGVSLLWPFSDERIKSPVPLFVGLRWSEPGAVLSHLTTFVTECLFAVAVVVVARLIYKRPQAEPTDAAL